MKIESVIFDFHGLSFMDLWRLGRLYRVASFVGLAAVLILGSFPYQRFMMGRVEGEKQVG